VQRRDPLVALVLSVGANKYAIRGCSELEREHVVRWIGWQQLDLSGAILIQCRILGLPIKRRQPAASNHCYNGDASNLLNK